MSGLLARLVFSCSPALEEEYADFCGEALEEEQTRLMITEESECPVNEGKLLVVAKVRAFYEHACALVVGWCECAKQPGFETLYFSVESESAMDSM